MMFEEHAEPLEVLMQKADYFYEFTEDMSVYRAGVIEQQQIVRRLGQIPMCEAARLIKRFVPKDLFLEFITRLISHHSRGF